MDIVEYLMAQNAHRKYLEQRTVQVNIPLFLPSRQIVLTLTPGQAPFAWIIYRLMFGEAMVPHQFSASVSWEGGIILSGIVSGQLINHPFETFSMSRNMHIAVQVQNLRNVVGYFEVTLFYLNIQRAEDYNIVIEDIKAFNGSMVGGTS